MALTDLYTLLPEIEPYLGPCPEPVIKQWLRVAARDFCAETEVWRESLAAVPTVADQADYTLAVTEGNDAIINRILEVKIDDNVVDESAYVYGPSGILTLDPAPVVSGLDMDIKVAYWPLTTCDEYPGWLMSRWSRGFVSGALFKLKAMSDKPWSDTNAMMYQRDYLDWVAKGKMEVFQGRMAGQTLIQKRRWM